MHIYTALAGQGLDDSMYTSLGGQGLDDCIYTALGGQWLDDCIYTALAGQELDDCIYAALGGQWLSVMEPLIFRTSPWFADQTSLGNTTMHMGSPGTKIAGSSSPWIDVFALPEKSNMAVTGSDPDPKVRKMSITFWACGHGTEMLLILKKIFLSWFFPNIFRYDSPKKCPTILYAVNLWLKSVLEQRHLISTPATPDSKKIQCTGSYSRTSYDIS